MWQETKHGLYKQFNFENFKEAWAFMVKVAELAEEYQHHPRWENEWSVVQIWLITHEGDQKITDKDREMAKAIDALVPDQSSGEVSQDVTNVPHPDKVKVFGDGGSRGNPGPSASGFVVLDMEDNILVDKGVYLGVTTNNQAEYTALKLALEECRNMGVQEVQVYMDSLLVVNQMKGIFKVKNRELWPLHDAIKELVKNFKHVSFSHVPREFNKLADAAVNRALDEHQAADLDKNQQG
ncbi:MAG: fructose-2,6-bisphosphatase, putative phosphoglycerate mutase [Candidatus Saccharibacteria bacterium]|nr:fructose-2,6-bisphosphatase, putative phosphoglycerate mutase [Candidatus Saccharibacteria bacterium]